MKSAALRTVELLRDKPRPFKPDEKALIRKVHGYMPLEQLLEVLNERLVADLGADEPMHTMEQLYTEIGDVVDAAPAGGHDWSSLRKLLAKAKRDGTLEAINRQVIDDFAVVFSLSPGQLLRLQDVLLNAEEGDDK